MSTPGIKQRVANVVMGQAIYDALFLPAEHQTKAQIQSRRPYPSGFQIYIETHRPKMGHHWKASEYSDDTEQMLCVLDTYLNQNDYGSDVDPYEFARVLKYWLVSNGRGSGQHTEKVLNHPAFGDTEVLDPDTASRDVWEQSGKVAMPNGSLMRNSAVGILRPWDLDWTERNAVAISRLTHYAPECVAACVAHAVCIACLVMGQPVSQALSECTMRASKYDPECVKLILNPSVPEVMDLDEGLDGTCPVRVGYVYKALAAAFWALQESQKWDPHVPQHLQAHHDLVRLAYCGGDTDTVGCISASLVGARMSGGNWHKHLVSGLLERVALENRVNRLLDRYPIGMVPN